MIRKWATIGLTMGILSLFQTAKAGEPQLKQITYRGGVVVFSIPANWKEEYEPDGGGMFYDPTPEAGTLRLKVITAKSPTINNDKSATEVLSSLRVAQSRQIEALTNGNALLHYSDTASEAGHKLHILYWIVANPVGSNHVRIVTFSYALFEEQQKQQRFAKDIALLDSEIRKASFAKELGQTAPLK